MNVLIAGAGHMGGAYLSVLKTLGVTTRVVGRSSEGCIRFSQEHGHPAESGGLELALSSTPPPEFAIVATSADQLPSTTGALLRAGTRRILVEKPGALSLADLLEMQRLAKESGADVYIGFNRRFYASTLAAERLIQDDGGVLSFTFEFTEIEERVLSYEHPPGVLENWFIANSSHVLDMAFFLGGDPVHLSAYTGHKLHWNPVGIYAGAGTTNTGAFFCYHANWDSAGRWSIDICTVVRRLIFRPLESLQVQVRGQFGIESVVIDDAFDRTFKPGLYRQVRAFLLGEMQDHLLPIHDYIDRFRLLERIRNPLA